MPVGKPVFFLKPCFQRSDKELHDGSSAIVNLDTEVSGGLNYGFRFLSEIKLLYSVDLRRGLKMTVRD